MTAAEVLAFLHAGGHTRVDPSEHPRLREVALSGVAPDRQAEPGALAWISEKNLRADPSRLASFRGSLLICPEGFDEAAGVEAAIPCSNPRLAFADVLRSLFGELSRTVWPTAGEPPVASGAVVGERVTLGHGVVIGSNTVIGDDVSIGPNTCIANAIIASGVRIGTNCTIGLPGFGFDRHDDGRYHRFPHVGRVRIEEEVEIGSNVCIDRGSIGDTVIGRGTKVDNLVHVAHNVVLGRDVLVIANSMIGGSTVVEDGAWIAPSVSLMNQITVGEGALVGMGSVVIRNVEPRTTVVGNPAKPLNRSGEK